MRIGIFGNAVNTGTLDDVVAEARGAADAGFASFWVPQIFGQDALTALAVIGREVPRIELGTGVVPTYPRHPVVLAQQALTTQGASGGRLVLGIGLSHQIVIETMMGLDYSKPVRHLREYLSILLPLLRNEGASFAGETLTGHVTLDVKGATPVPVIVAALGPQMLALAGALTDGTYTWCVGPKTLESHIIPGIREAAAAAGRAVPRIVTALPVCVTDHPTEAGAMAAKVFEMYAHLPSYRAMLDREGVSGMGDLAIMGGESQVAERIEALGDLGVTDFAAVEYSTHPAEAARTRDLLRRLL